MMSRLERLKEFLEQDPDDPFNLYALAIEYLGSEPAESKALFDRLMNEHPTYVPTYYHAAKLYEQLNMTEKAIAIYEKGISIASTANDKKAERELRSSLDELRFE